MISSAGTYANLRVTPSYGAARQIRGPLDPTILATGYDLKVTVFPRTSTVSYAMQCVTGNSQHCLPGYFGIVDGRSLDCWRHGKKGIRKERSLAGRGLASNRISFQLVHSSIKVVLFIYTSLHIHCGSSSTAFLPTKQFPLSSSLQCLADAIFLEQGSKIKLPWTSVKRNSA